jgi:L-Ala-D/L-Glu epimerase
MKRTIITLEIRELKIPFKQSFKHHSAERNITQTVLVTAGDGELKGYGESCPREYVTGESVQSALKFFAEVRETLVNQVNDLESLKEYATSFVENINQNPSAWCAIELALLDLFAKRQHCSVERLLNLPELEGSFFYTAVIGDGSFEAFEKMASQYIQMGFKDFKIKITGNAALDFPKLILLKKLAGDTSKIRLDANNLWSNIEDVLSYLSEIPVQLSGLEEPLSGTDLSQLKKLAEQISIPIILDESFNRIEQISELMNHKDAFIINLRVSKMGGLLNSIEIADKARKENIGLIIGAQVGETSILTRAALSVANFCKGYYRAIEGGFGTLLLEHDVVEVPLMFGKAGELESGKSLKAAHGLQLAIKDDLINGVAAN